MARNLLTDRKCRTSKPRAKPYRLFDGEGLALLVSPTGARSWQLRYRLNGREQTATLGRLDRLPLAEARARADELRRLVDQGEHLTLAKRRDRMQRQVETATTFGVVAQSWIKQEVRRQRWTPDYLREVKASFANHLADLDPLPISEIDARIAAPLLSKIETESFSMLDKVRPRLNGVLNYAVEHGFIPHNPLPAVRRRKSVQKSHYAAIVKLPEIGEILRAARAVDVCRGVQRAHLLLTFTALRVSEVVGAKWTEFQLDGVDVPIEGSQLLKHDPAAGNWSVPRERMKAKDPKRGPHVVPLPPVLLEQLREWRKDDGPGAVFVCVAPRNATKPITVEGIEKFYRKMLALDGKHSPHSWRSAFSTICREAGKDSDTIENQLDHIVGNTVASSYDRAKRLELRRTLLRWYEGQLLAARDGAAVLPIRARGT